MKEKFQENKQNLSSHVKRLLGKTQRSFVRQESRYALFLALLVGATEYNYVIQGIDPGILLLLNEPHNFWLSGNLENEKLEAIEAKRDIIREIILEQLEEYIRQCSQAIEKKEMIEAFYGEKKAELSEKNQDQDMLFSQNMDFAKPRKKGLLSKDELIHKFTFPTASVLAGAAARVAYLYKTGQYSDAPLDRHTEKAITNTWLLTFFVAGGVSYKLLNFAFNYIGKNSTQHLQKKLFKNQFLAQFFHLLTNQSGAQQDSLERGEQEQPNFQNSNHIDASDKQPWALKQYFDLELGYMQHEIGDFGQFIQLCESLIFSDEIPLLTDLGYDLPLEILHDPEATWFYDRELTKDLKPLLQRFLKLALTEYLIETITNSSEDKDYSDLLEKLKAEKEKITEKINDLEEQELSDKIKSEAFKPHDIKLTAFISASVLFSLFMDNYFVKQPRTHTAQQNQLGVWQAFAVLGGAVSTVAIGSYGFYKGYSHLAKKFGYLSAEPKQRTKMTCGQFINQTQGSSQKLKIS